MAYDFRNTTVLVVESSPPVFEILRDVLGLFTVPQKNIFSAYTMDEGFRKFCADNHDLVIVDWMENPNTGIRLTHQIRTNKESPNRYVPILMTAGSGHANKVVRARDVGISGYLVKPFSAKKLAEKIERIIEHPRPFIVHSSFFGPDRRIKQVPFEGPDRRMQAPELIKAPV